jgi:hypothetical protein
MNATWKVASTALLGALIVMSGAACQKQDTQVKPYAKDGLLGITDVNPNMPTSPTYHTYQADTELMKAAIREVPHVTGSAISIYGDVASVRLEIPTSLSDQDRVAVQQDAYDKLSKAMPRYTVKVSVSHK